MGAIDEMKTVEVFSNCDRVELFFNGKSLGKKEREFNWQVQFVAGSNSLKAIGIKANSNVTNEIKINYSVK